MPFPPVQAAFLTHGEGQSSLHPNPFGLPEDNPF